MLFLFLFASSVLGAEFDAIECSVDLAYCQSAQAARGGAADPLHLAGGEDGHGAGAKNMHIAGSQLAGAHLGAHEPPAHATGPWKLFGLYAIIAALVLANIALLLALKKGKAVTACMPPSMSIAMGIGANDKQV